MQAKLLKKFEENNTNINLYYVDYRDSLDESPGILEEIIQTWYTEEDVTDRRETWESIDYMINETFDDEERENLDDETIEDIRNYCYENDESNVLGDLIENTRGRLFLVDLDYNFSDPEDQENAIKEIKEFLDRLGIEETQETIDDIRDILAESRWWNAYAWLFLESKEIKNQFLGDYSKNIKIERLQLIIKDDVQWSWRYGEVRLSGDFTVSRKNILIDWSCGYSFEEIFWQKWEDLYSRYELTDEKENIEENEDIKTKKEDEKRREENYRKHGCGWSDCPKFDHHQTEYTNGVPAGNKCKICWRFFID